MLLKICEYIKAANLSDDDDIEIKIESAMSLIVSAIDFTDNPSENVVYISDQQAKIINLMINVLVDATIDVLMGNYDRGRMIW